MAAVSMETNSNDEIGIGFDDDFRECSSQYCRNDCLREKETCKHCAEIVDLKAEIIQLRDINDRMKEYILDHETNQNDKMKKRKIDHKEERQEEKCRKDLGVLPNQIQNYI